MKLGLDSLTLNDTDPVDLIQAASKAGFDQVSLWVQPPSIFPRQLVTPARLPACLAALADTGVQVGPLEVFDLGSSEAIKSYRPALELGARLGAQSASAINVRNQDPVAVAELFAQFAEAAREFGLPVTLEPLARLATSTVAQARAIIRASCVDAGIVLDALHLVRMGGTAADVRSLEPDLVRYVQVCDGAAAPTPEELRVEATYERMYPGEGVFPLAELLRDAPTHVPWGIEAPSRRRVAAGMTAEAQALAAMAALQGLIGQCAVMRNGPGY